MRPNRAIMICASILLVAAFPLAAQPGTQTIKPVHDEQLPGVANLTGGPDAFGYTFTDSTEPGGPVFDFLDISASGTPVILGDDAEDGPFPIGFAFDFYGTPFTDFFIDSNGFMNFIGGAGAAFSNDCPFDPGSPPEMIAPYWDDLDPGDDGAAAYFLNFPVCPVGSATGCTVVQWDMFDFFPGDGTPGGTAGSFQVILYDNGEILMQYDADLLGDGSSATVGISADGGAFSLLYSCNTPGSITPGLAILFSPPQAFEFVIDCPAGCPGDCDILVAGAPAHSQVVVMRSPALGPPGGVIGGGACVGLEMDLADPLTRVVRLRTDMNGEAIIPMRFFRRNLCEENFQAFEQDSCELTNVDSPGS